MLLKEYIVSLRDFFIEKRNQFFGNKKYNKFIVITRSRTGSNLLMSFLNSHPQIIAKGELFRRLEGKTCKKVWDKTFSKKPKHIKYVGFKIFYYHPLDSEDKEVWEYIKKDKNIKLIHLTRSNILKTIISRQIADKTNVWGNKNRENIQLVDKQVEINTEQCFNEFELTQESENKTRNEFKRDFFLEINYEDLINDSQNKMNEIFNYLNLEETKVKSSYKKQNKEDLKDLVINYNELKIAIEQSKWSYLLDLE